MKDFFKGDIRTIKAKKNILASIVLKGLDGIVYVLIVPVTLDYLNQYEYGVWLTLSSILMWINSFDMGLGNGLRNKLAIAIAEKNFDLGKIYVSTTFCMLFVLMSTILVFGLLIFNYIDWYEILNTNVNLTPHLKEIVYITFGIFCMTFVFKFIGNIYLAMQLPAINNLLVFSGNLLALVLIFVLTKTTKGNLLGVATVFSISPLLIYIISYPITFKKIFPKLKPSIKCFKKQYLKDLFNLGIQFFIIQISAIVLFSITNVLISHMFGPEEVTPYNISYRYFSIVLMVLNLLLAPMWSATTDAYAQGELYWIKNVMKRIQKIVCLISLGIIVMILMSTPVYKIWVGSDVKIPFLLSALMGIYICILVWSITYSNFLNGLGKLKLQTVNIIIVAILFLPICYLLGKLLGICGLVVGMCLLNLSGLILNKIQFYRIINKKAIGIWNE